MYAFPISVVINVVQDGVDRPEAFIFSENDFGADCQNWGSMFNILNMELKDVYSCMNEKSFTGFEMYRRNF